MNNIMTSKSRLGVTQDHWKWHHSIDAYEFLSYWCTVAVYWIISKVKRDSGRKSRYLTCIRRFRQTVPVRILPKCLV